MEGESLNFPSKRCIDAVLFDDVECQDDEDTKKRQKLDQVFIQDGSKVIQSRIFEPRFTLEQHPNPIQRKSYGQEHRCIVPRPLVVMSNEKDSSVAAVVAGLVTVSLVDFKGKEIPEQSNVLTCEKGLTQRLEKLRNESPTVWSHFSLRPNETSDGSLVRLRFEIDYILEDDLTTVLRERIFTKPFEIISKKRSQCKKSTSHSSSTSSASDSSPTSSSKVKGEGVSVQVTILPSISVELSQLLEDVHQFPLVDLERPFCCSFPDCSKAFKRADHLRNHQVIHTPALQKQYQCTYCKREFHLKHHLDCHEKIHQREFQCDFQDCTATFDKESQLLTHKKKHTNIKPYSCDHPGCHLLFDYPSQLKKHQKTHQNYLKSSNSSTSTSTGSKTYSCTTDGCNLILSTKEKLRFHLREAHAITKEMCPLCGGSFVYLSQHLLQAHKMENGAAITLHACEEAGCEAAFINRGNLNLHMGEQHELKDAMFLCDHGGCDGAFYRKATLDQHKRSHNQIQELVERREVDNIFKSVFRIEAVTTSTFNSSTTEPLEPTEFSWENQVFS